MYGIVDIYLRPLRRDLRDLRDLRAFLDLRRDDLLLRRLPPCWLGVVPAPGPAPAPPFINLDSSVLIANVILPGEKDTRIV